jgi:hypothetical protein
MMIKPLFTDPQDWEKAELLMQPIFIRVVDTLRKQLETSEWQGAYQEIADPYPGHQLCLSRQDQNFTLDLWDLCFQICFLDYHPQPWMNENHDHQREYIVTIDSRLLNEEGEIDWHELDDKTQSLIQKLFETLP